MGRNLRYRESDVEAFAKSGAIEKYKVKISQIQRAFALLSQDDQQACEALAAKYLSLDAERNERMDDDVVDESEISLEQFEEDYLIAEEISRWFPFVEKASEADKPEYACAFLEYMGARKGAQ
jgi:hypothetical protein